MVSTAPISAQGHEPYSTGSSRRTANSRLTQDISAYITGRRLSDTGQNVDLLLVRSAESREPLAHPERKASGTLRNRCQH
jgi:hypothetical protein